MILDDLKIPFRFYEALAETVKGRAECNSYRFKLITPNDRLLPFIIRFPTPASPSLPAHLNIYNSDSGDLVVAVSDGVAVSLLGYYRFNGNDFIVYKGDQSLYIALTGGFYYAVVEMVDGTKYYSDEFWVDCDGLGSNLEGDFNNDFSDAFNNGSIATSLPKYTKLTWWNSCDIGSILYQTGYQNILYIDADVVKGETQYTEEGSEDGNKDFVPKFQKLIDTITIQDYMPDYIINALSAVIMHDNAYCVTKDNWYIGEVNRFDLKFTWQTKCYAVATMNFNQETVFLNSQCCGNNAITDLYECTSRIGNLIINTHDNGDGTASVTLNWSVLSGAPPYWVVSPQISGGAPTVTGSTTASLGNWPHGHVLDVTVKPYCGSAANGHIMFGNLLTTNIIVP